MCTWVHDVLRIINSKILQVAVLDYFVLSMLTNILFQFPECMKQLEEIRHTCTLKQLVGQILKTNSVTYFLFHFYGLSLMVLNLVVVSTINLQWNCLLAFCYPPLQTIQVGKTFDGEAKI